MPGPLVGRRMFDPLEKIIVLAIYLGFLDRVAQAVMLTGSISAALIGISETLVLVMILFRKPAVTLSQRPLDWCLAFGGTIAPLLFRPTETHLTLLTEVAVVFGFVGIAFQIYSKFHLGRRFGVVAANRGIYSRGPYSLVRHPIYLGYLVTHVAFVVTSPSAWNVFVLLLTYSLQIPRIFSEERLLTDDQAYAIYRGAVRWRLVPGLL